MDRKQNPMSLRDQIASAMKQVASEHEKNLAPLSDDIVLLNSGLDSLGFAVLIARLERDLDVDPFSSAEEISFPVTFGDLVRLYEDATRRHEAA